MNTLLGSIYLNFERSIGMNLIRQLFVWLDWIAFTVFEWAIQAVFDIASIPIVDNSVYENFRMKIYVLLGIFMLFKITMTMLNYLVNPDAMTDKEKGMGKLLTRTILVIIMLIGFPVIFNLMGEVQEPLMKALPRIILSTDMDTTSASAEMESVGKTISWQVYGISFDTATFQNATGENTIGSVVTHINDHGDNRSEYKYGYMPFLGLVIALVMAFILIGFAIDVAIRAFKLVILQLIAPIPIISYIDPKSSKDGAFSSWVKMLTSTWLDLFIKIGILYFVLYMIDLVVLSNGFSLGGLPTPRNIIVIIFIIVGLLFFAKQAPKFITDALGIKQKEGNGLFGGLAKIAAAGAIGAGAIGSAAAAGRASFLSDSARGKSHNPLNLAKNLGAGLFGGVTGAATGATAALGAKDHASRAAMDAMNKQNANRLALGAAGSTWLGRAAESASQVVTGETMFDRQNRMLKDQEDFVKSAGAFQKDLKAEAIKGKYGPVSVDGGGNYLGGSQIITGNSKTLRAQAQVAIANGLSKFKYDDGAGNVYDVSTTDYETIASDMEKKEMESLYAKFASGSDAGNPDLYADYQAVTAAGTSLGQKVSTTKELDNSKKTIAATVTRTKGSTRYRVGSVNSQASKK